MSDVEEDPYAVSSDSEDEKGPPPKIAIETTADLNQLKQALTADEKKPVKDEKTLEEIEELRKAKQEELSRVKREFEEGRASALQQLEGASVQKESLEGVGKENLISMKNMFENEPNKEFVRDANIGEELAQLSSLKEKKESWQTSAAEAQVGQRSSALLTPEELAAAGTVKGNKERFTSGIDTTAPVDDEEKRRQLEEIKSQVSEVKQKWRTGNVEGADMAQDDAGKREELEALKGVNIRERFQPPAEGEVQKCYDRSELDTSGAADARKSFLEGSAYASAKAESAAAGELNELKFTELNAYKDKFERGQGDAEEVERAKVELDLQLKELRKTFEKPESEMSPAERAAKKKAEIEAEFARYKLARKLQEQRAAQNEAATAELEKKADGTGADLASSRAAGGAEEEFDVKNLMAKFANLSDLSGAKAGGQQRNGSLEDLEALRVEAKNLREQFEKANQLEASETAEEKRRRLEEEFKQLKEERERARQELEAEQAETAAAMAAAGKEDIQVAADHAAKMTAKWEKIHKKEAKKAEKGRMPQKAGAGGGDQS